MSKRRIVSLIASSTEIICALGFEKQIVGRSHECDYPELIWALPVCTEPKLDRSGTSREIDDRVKAILQDALTVYRVDEILLKDLAPDVIVTQSQCDVCAVSMKDVEDIVRKWVGSNPQLVSLEPNELSDVWEDIRRVAEALDVPKRADELINRMQTRIGNISRKTASLEDRPTVACIEWIDPLIAGGNWMPELVGLAGGSNLFGETGKHSPWMTWEELLEKDPKVIVVMPCGFGVRRTREEMGTLTRRLEWRDLQAVQNGRVYLTDGHQYFNRPGPRLVESVEILAEIFHPETFNFGHRGTGWEAL